MKIRLPDAKLDKPNLDLDRTYLFSFGLSGRCVYVSRPSRAQQIYEPACGGMTQLLVNSALPTLTSACA